MLRIADAEGRGRAARPAPRARATGRAGARRCGSGCRCRGSARWSSGGWTPDRPAPAGRDRQPAARRARTDGGAALRRAGRGGRRRSAARSAATAARCAGTARRSSDAGARPAAGPARRSGCEPRLVGLVEFTGWVADGRLRLPRWRGLVDPADVRRRPALGAPAGPAARAGRPSRRGPAGRPAGRRRRPRPPAPAPAAAPDPAPTRRAGVRRRRRLEQHFVYNALNTIAALIRTDPGRARELLFGFADLSRAADQPGDATSTLGRELDAVRGYLQLEQARFGKRLRVRAGRRRRAATGVAGAPAARCSPRCATPCSSDIEPRPDGGVLLRVGRRRPTAAARSPWPSARPSRWSSSCRVAGPRARLSAATPLTGPMNIWPPASVAVIVGMGTVRACSAFPTAPARASSTSTACSPTRPACTPRRGSRCSTTTCGPAPSATARRSCRSTSKADYGPYVDGKPRLAGTDSFLRSRGIELPAGGPGDPPDAETHLRAVHDEERPGPGEDRHGRGGRLPGLGALPAGRAGTPGCATAVRVVLGQRRAGARGRRADRADRPPGRRGHAPRSAGCPASPRPDTFLAAAADLGRRTERGGGVRGRAGRRRVGQGGRVRLRGRRGPARARRRAARARRRRRRRRPRRAAGRRRHEPRSGPRRSPSSRGWCASRGWTWTRSARPSRCSRCPTGTSGCAATSTRASRTRCPGTYLNSFYETPAAALRRGRLRLPRVRPDDHQRHQRQADPAAGRGRAVRPALRPACAATSGCWTCRPAR